MSRWHSYRHELDYREREYLETRMGHKWRETAKFKVCETCGLRQKISVGWQLRAKRRQFDAIVCPKAKRPNRWRIHYSRWLDRKARSEAQVKVERGGAADILAQLQELEREAKRLPQDMETWQRHPVARRYRRLVRRWWQLPVVPVEVAQKSSTWNLPLTAKGKPAERNDLAAADTARAAIRKVETEVGRRYGQPEGELADLARKAAHAVRKIRPDLFELGGL